MTMEKIVVSDTNIFIDLVKLELLGDFFSLPWDIHTTDFVISELEVPEQKAAVTAFIKRKKLTVGKLDAEEVGIIVERSEETGGKISITDFSVCYYAQKNGYTLLTGDMNLRKVATKENISVHGILFLFDELVKHAILPPELAADIADRGIVLTGGGALLHGLEDLIEENTGITTMTAEEPLTAVAIGTGKYIEYLSEKK